MIINFRILLLQLCPAFTRSGLLVAYIDSVSVALGTLLNNYTKYKSECEYDIQHTSQKCYVAAALNDAIDKYDRRITVEDIEALDYFYAYDEEESIDVDIDDNTVCYDDAIAGISAVSFAVNIPSLIYSTDVYNKAFSITKKYKIIGRSFMINKV